MPMTPTRRDLTFTTGGGCMMLFGLPFFVAGLVAMSVSIMQVINDGEYAALVGVPFGLIFVVVGGAFIFGRSRVVFDPMTGEWETYTGALGIGKRRTGSFSEVQEVTISRQVHRTKNSTYVTFPVKVKLTEGKDISVENPRDFHRARGMAERLCKGLNVPLMDGTGSELRKVMPEHLDKNLKEKLKAGEVKIEQVGEPSRKKCVYEVDGTTVSFTMPGVNIAAAIGGAVMAVVIPLLVYFMFVRHIAEDFSKGDTPPELMYFFGGFVVFFFMVLPVAFGLGLIIRTLITREKVTVSPYGIELAKKGLLTRTVTISSDEIEEVEVRRLDTGGSGTVTVASDKQVINFGQSLSEQEKKWMASVIRSILAA